MTEFGIYSFDEGWQHNPMGLLIVYTPEGACRRSMRIDKHRRDAFTHYVQCDHTPDYCIQCYHYVTKYHVNDYWTADELKAWEKKFPRKQPSSGSAYTVIN